MGAAGGRAIDRAVLWRFLSLGFRANLPAAAAVLGSEEGLREAIEAAAAIADGRPGLFERARAVVEAVRKLPDGRLAAAGLRLFGPTVRGCVPPYETEYGGPHVFQKADDLADIAGFYRAFGVSPSRRLPERPDHLGSELEFLGLLAMKEGLAAEAGDAEAEAICRGAAASFVRDHLGRWLRSFLARLREADPPAPFGPLGDLLEAFAESEAAEHGVALGPAGLPLKPPEAADACAACPVAPAPGACAEPPGSAP